MRLDRLLARTPLQGERHVETQRADRQRSRALEAVALRGEIADERHRAERRLVGGLDRHARAVHGHAPQRRLAGGVQAVGRPRVAVAFPDDRDDDCALRSGGRSERAAPVADDGIADGRLNARLRLAGRGAGACAERGTEAGAGDRQRADDEKPRRATHAADPIRGGRACKGNA